MPDRLRVHAFAWLPMVLLSADLGSPQVAFAPGPELGFRHRSGGADKRYILETMGSGVAIFDYDGDSDLDLYFVNAASWEEVEGSLPAAEPNRLFRNEGRMRFTDVTEASGLGDRGFGQGVAAGDFDNDGDEDLYLTNFGPNRLYRNNGDGTFTAMDAGMADPGWGASAAFADVDDDGFLDLYSCNYLEFDRESLDRLIPRQFCLWKGIPVNCGPRGFPHGSGMFYRNLGDGRFREDTASAGLLLDQAYPLGLAFSDLDGDGDSELYVASDSTANFLFENLGDGRFRDVSIVSGAALSHLGAEQAGMGVDAGDVDGDGLPDLFVTNFSDDYNTLYVNQGELRFIDAADLSGLSVSSLSTLGWSAFLEDFDLDEDLDILVVNGHVYPQVDASDVAESFRQPIQIFWNDGTGRFRAATEEESGGLGRELAARGAAVGDLDGDGDRDVVVNVLDGAPVLLVNQLDPGVTDASLRLRLVGRTANRDGLGTKVLGSRRGVHEVRAARGYLSSSSPWVLLATAGTAVLERLELQWPSKAGRRQVFEAIAPGSYVVVEGGDLHEVRLNDSPVSAIPDRFGFRSRDFRDLPRRR